MGEIKIKANKITLISALAAAVLSACGGGGDAMIVSIVPPVPVVVTPPSMVMNVPDATYAMDSEEAKAFALLNAERSHCGFGKLAQNVKLDQAAKAHANWLITNNYRGHYESPDVQNGFTGVTSNDRALAAGYVPGLSEVTETIFSIVGPSDSSKSGLKSVRSLLAAPYHTFGMMSPYRDVGISVQSAGDKAWDRAVYNYNFGTQGNMQLIERNAVLTYPCQGTVGTNYELLEESPNPVPGRNLITNPLGHPVLVMVRFGQKLEISSSRMMKVATGAQVAMRTPITAENDPNNTFLGYGIYMGYVIPDGPLEPDAEYAVSVTGTNDGNSFIKEFTFKTGFKLK